MLINLRYKKYVVWLSFCYQICLKSYSFLLFGHYVIPWEFINVYFKITYGVADLFRGDCLFFLLSISITSANFHIFYDSVVGWSQKVPSASKTFRFSLFRKCRKIHFIFNWEKESPEVSARGLLKETFKNQIYLKCSPKGGLQKARHEKLVLQTWGQTRAY
jgi:hypothetical protein